MFKEVKYDQPFAPKAKKSVYEQEYKLIQDFFSSNAKNMRFEYINVKNAHYAYSAITRHAQRTRTPIVAQQRGNYVFGTRKEGEEQ